MSSSSVVSRFSRWLYDFKIALHSWEGTLKFLETKESALSRHGERNVWSNVDLDVSPKEDWTWTWWDYAAFWWSYDFSVGVWSLGSSMITLGLTYWQAIICVFMGHLLGAIGVVLHSRSAAVYHFGFPVESRVAWGMRGAFFPVIVRVMVGTIRNGLAAIEGGYFVAIFLRCVIGKPFYEMHNPIPSSSDITIQELTGKEYLDSKIDAEHGFDLEYRCQQPDLARYARTPSAPVLSQLIALVVGNTLCATLGIFATSSIQLAWGTLVWNPWDLSNLILTTQWDAGVRAGIAIVSLGFMLSVFASNLGANLIPWGADISILVPRFINIRRGMYISWVIAICICPWHILKSATTFLRFLGGYSVFLGPLVGITITDYFVIRRGNIWVKELYSSDPNGRYWYTFGINRRATVAFLVAVILPIPGFSALFGQKMGIEWTHIYSVGWHIGCVLSSVCYYGLCMWGNICKQERGMMWEEVAKSDSVLVGRGSEEGSSGIDVAFEMVIAGGKKE